MEIYKNIFLQINLLNDKKLELERRIDSLISERESLSVTLDESTDRIMMLEKQSREQEQLVRYNLFYSKILFSLNSLKKILIINWFTQYQSHL